MNKSTVFGKSSQYFFNIINFLILKTPNHKEVSILVRCCGRLSISNNFSFPLNTFEQAHFRSSLTRNESIHTDFDSWCLERIPWLLEYKYPSKNHWRLGLSKRLGRVGVGSFSTGWNKKWFIFHWNFFQSEFDRLLGDEVINEIREEVASSNMLGKYRYHDYSDYVWFF